jgi:hypothetical protein
MSVDTIRFSEFPHKNMSWSLTVPANTTLEEVLNPSYLANVAPKLSLYDRVHVSVDTGEWYAELLVVSCGRVWAKLVPLVKIDLTSKDDDQLEGEAFEKFIVQYRGPHLKFCIVRKEDKESIKENLQTKVEAHNWLASYVMTL